MRCAHEESLHGRCVACGKTWEEQARDPRTAAELLEALRAANPDWAERARRAPLPEPMTKEDAEMARAERAADDARENR